MEPAWDREALLASPLLHTVRPFIAALPAERFPDGTTLSALARDRDVRNAVGLPIRFVSPKGGTKVAACDYEGRAYHAGEVLTRPDNWHDCFNALAWAAFPCSKAAINRAHIDELARQTDSRRSARRDALTQFDEDGMVVVSSDGALLELIRDFQWKRLFVERRAEVCEHMRFYVLGHALHEKALAPYRGVTGKAVLLEVEPTLWEQPVIAQLDVLDARVAADIESGALLQTTRSLQPLPILGIPGWCAANEQPEYYEDTWQFRPGRRRAA